MGSHLESDRFEMVHDDLKAPVYFKIRVILQNGSLDLSILNDNDRDVWTKGEFYVLDKDEKPIHHSMLGQYPWHKSHSSNLLDMNRISNERHEKLAAGKTASKQSLRTYDLMNNKEKLMPGGILRIGCKFSLSI